MFLDLDCPICGDSHTVEMREGFSLDDAHHLCRRCRRRELDDPGEEPEFESISGDDEERAEQ